MDLKSELNNELEDDEEDKDPKGVVETTQLHTSSWHSETQHDGWNWKYMGQCTDNKVCPIEVGSILVCRMWTAESDEGLEVKTKKKSK